MLHITWLTVAFGIVSSTVVHTLLIWVLARVLFGAKLRLLRTLAAAIANYIIGALLGSLVLYAIVGAAITNHSPFTPVLGIPSGVLVTALVDACLGTFLYRLILRTSNNEKLALKRTLTLAIVEQSVLLACAIIAVGVFHSTWLHAWIFD